MTALSLEGVDRAEWESFVSADRTDLQSLFIRTNDLQTRIDKLSKKTDELHRSVTTTHARIECAGKVVKVVAACGFVALVGFVLQYLSEKRTRARVKKYKDPTLHKASKDLGKEMCVTKLVT